MVALQPLNRARRSICRILKAEGYKVICRSLSFNHGPIKKTHNSPARNCGPAGTSTPRELACIAQARLTYRLDGRCIASLVGRFCSTTRCAEGGAAVCAVYVDDKLAWKSKVVRGDMPPIPLQVDTIGAKRLSLLVEFADAATNWIARTG